MRSERFSPAVWRLLSRSPRVDPLQHWLPRHSLRAVNLGSARLLVPAPLPGVTSIRVEVTLCRWSNAAFAPPVGIASSLMGPISVFVLGASKQCFLSLIHNPLLWTLVFALHKQNEKAKEERTRAQTDVQAHTHTHTQTHTVCLCGVLIILV